MPNTGRGVVLATAAAFEHPLRHVESLVALVGAVTNIPVLRRADSSDPTNVSLVEEADTVYLLGPNPMHQRSAFQGTPLFEAISRVMPRGGTVVGIGWAGAGLCDPAVDPRGGGLGLGLGLVRDTAMYPIDATTDRMHIARTVGLAGKGIQILAIDSDGIAVFDGTTWSTAGATIAYRGGKEVTLGSY